MAAGAAPGQQVITWKVAVQVQNISDEELTGPDVAMWRPRAGMVTVTSLHTVGDMKVQLTEQLRIPLARQRVLYDGYLLLDDSTSLTELKFRRRPQIQVQDQSAFETIERKKQRLQDMERDILAPHPAYCAGLIATKTAVTGLDNRMKLLFDVLKDSSGAVNPSDLWDEIQLIMPRAAPAIAPKLKSSEFKESFDGLKASKRLDGIKWKTVNEFWQNVLSEFEDTNSQPANPPPEPLVTPAVPDSWLPARVAIRSTLVPPPRLAPAASKKMLVNTAAAIYSWPSWPTDAVHHIESATLSDVLERARAAVEAEPRNGWAHYDLGTALHALERYQEAARHLVEATRLVKADPLMLQRLAVVQELAVQYEDCAETLKKLIKLQPQDWEPHADLGNVLSRLGHLQDAASAWHNAAERGAPIEYSVQAGLAWYICACAPDTGSIVDRPMALKGLKHLKATMTRDWTRAELRQVAAAWGSDTGAGPKAATVFGLTAGKPDLRLLPDFQGIVEAIANEADLWE